MMYILAAWTGFRKSEIGSLTAWSLRLEDDPATATVDACYSKRRQRDTQILHPEVARQLKLWLQNRNAIKSDPGILLFPVSASVPGSVERKTSHMIKRDLMAARRKWIEEVEEGPERKQREQSSFLSYCDHNGLFADFHSLRHAYITGLARAGVTPRVAQILARHSDIRLTLGLYTHVELHDHSKAIGSLPAPPSADGGDH
jgi:hypothetical protein